MSTAPFFLRPSSTTPRCGNTQSPKQALRESTGADHITAKDSRGTLGHLVRRMCPRWACSLCQFSRVCAHRWCSTSIWHTRTSRYPPPPHHRWVTYLVPVVLRTGLWVRPVEPSHQSRTRRGRLAHHWSENMDKHCASFTMGNTSCPH